MNTTGFQMSKLVLVLLHLCYGNSEIHNIFESIIMPFKTNIISKYSSGTIPNNSLFIVENFDTKLVDNETKEQVNTTENIKAKNLSSTNVKSLIITPNVNNSESVLSNNVISMKLVDPEAIVNNGSKPNIITSSIVDPNNKDSQLLVNSNSSAIEINTKRTLESQESDYIVDNVADYIINNGGESLLSKIIKRIHLMKKLQDAESLTITIPQVLYNNNTKYLVPTELITDYNIKLTTNSNTNFVNYLPKQMITNTKLLSKCIPKSKSSVINDTEVFADDNNKLLKGSKYKLINNRSIFTLHNHTKLISINVTNPIVKDNIEKIKQNKLKVTSIGTGLIGNISMDNAKLIKGNSSKKININNSADQVDENQIKSFENYKTYLIDSTKTKQSNDITEISKSVLNNNKKIANDVLEPENNETNVTDNSRGTIYVIEANNYDEPSGFRNKKNILSNNIVNIKENTIINDIKVMTKNDKLIVTNNTPWTADTMGKFSRKQDAIFHTCNGVVFHGVYYAKQLLFKNLIKPHSLMMHEFSGELFFSHTITNGKKSEFKITACHVEKRICRDIRGVPGGYAIAYDRNNDDIYFGGQDGIYKYNFHTRTAEFFAEKGISIRGFFIRRHFYYINYNTRKLYLYQRAKFSEVIAAKKIEIDNFFVSKDIDIYFSNKTGLYKVNRINKIPYVLNDKIEIRQIVEDVAGNVYFCANDGIYIEDNVNRHVIKVADIDPIFGMTFIKISAFNKVKNQLIYSSEDAIYRLLPSKYSELCAIRLKNANFRSIIMENSKYYD